MSGANNHTTPAECPRCFASTFLSRYGKLHRHQHRRYRGNCPAIGMRPEDVGTFKRVIEPLRWKKPGYGPTLGPDPSGRVVNGAVVSVLP